MALQEVKRAEFYSGIESMLKDDVRSTFCCLFANKERADIDIAKEHEEHYFDSVCDLLRQAEISGTFCRMSWSTFFVLAGNDETGTVRYLSQLIQKMEEVSVRMQLCAGVARIVSREIG